MVLSRGAANLRVSASTKATGCFAADIELRISIGEQQGLRIGVDSYKLNTLQAFLDHAVNSVDATATDTDNADHGEVVARRGHGRGSPFRVLLWKIGQRFPS